MHISSLSESKYLKKEDVQPPVTVQITGVSKEDLSQENDPPEFKYVLHFNGPTKPMVLNVTNAQLIAHVLQSEETDDWIHKEITLYNDPSVSFAGKLTGGIRVQVNPVPSGDVPF